MKIFAITCTGDRPLAFSLCKKWMLSQTQQVDEWWIIDDGEVPLEFDPADPGDALFTDYVRAAPMEGHSLDRNLNYALMVAEHRHSVGDIKNDDLVVFWEDDDFMQPNYLKHMKQAFTQDKALQIVGEEKSIYYNLAERRYKILQGRPYAALCQTVIRGSLLPLALRVLHNKPPDNTFDVALWRECCNRHTPRRLIPGEPLVVGIKGMPGRKGIGRGHYAENVSEWIYDRDFLRLELAIGSKEAYGKYCEIIKRLQEEKNQTADPIPGPAGLIQPGQS